MTQARAMEYNSPEFIKQVLETLTEEKNRRNHTARKLRVSIKRVIAIADACGVPPWKPDKSPEDTEAAVLVALEETAGNRGEAAILSGYSSCTVGNVARKFGIPQASRGRPRQWTDEEEARIVELSEGGMSRYDIADAMGRTINAVRNKIKMLQKGRRKKDVLAAVTDATNLHEHMEANGSCAGFEPGECEVPIKGYAPSKTRAEIYRERVERGEDIWHADDEKVLCLADDGVVLW